MKRLSVPVRIIVIVYLVIAFFMLVDPPQTVGSLKLARTDYGGLFVNILALTVVAVLALVVLSLSIKHRHSPTG